MNASTSIRAALALVACAVGTSASAADTFVYDIVGGWTVHTDRARNFTCFMQARFEGDSVIRLGYDMNGRGVQIFVADPAWSSISPDTTYSAEISFGDETAWQGEATGVTLDEDSGLRALSFAVDAGRAQGLKDQLMRRYSVSVAYDGREPVTLSLGGSYRAGLKLDECQESMAEVARDKATEAAPSAESPLSADR